VEEAKVHCRLLREQKKVIISRLSPSSAEVVNE
jgi:hypothetical protein